MTILSHELRRGKVSWIIWTAIIAGMLGICVLVFPELKDQMAQMSDMVAQMGSFADAFGMDRVDLQDLLGFIGIECGELLGLGGAMFAAILGIQALAKEEKEHTAEFLLTHPINRSRVVAEKLAAVMIQLLAMNICVWIVLLLSSVIVGEKMDIGRFAVLMSSYLIMQIEVASITFGISAFLKKSGMGIGLGLALVLYFLELIANMSSEMTDLKFLTPFSYANGADVVDTGVLTVKYLIPGIILTILGICGAFWKYNRKDIS